jgi:hypothetical protein
VSAPTPDSFYREDVPRQWNRLLADQERAVESARRVLDAMRAVNATIRVEVRGPGGGTFFLNVKQGEMSAGDAAAQPPFLTVVQERDTFERVAREAGDSALGLLGGLAGLTGEMRLTAGRIRNLAAVQGMIEFAVTGENGFRLRTHFGPGPVPDEPQTVIRVDEQGYRDLREGRLDPQQAFMSGKLAVEGDLQLAMQLALAALSPD